jgi:Zn-dependent peptidase ImmA (M78 family)/transcriptional regulator with XRE-family HTH domain
VIGEKLRHAREINGWTQLALADKVGVQQAFIAMLERGAREPSPEMLQAIADKTGFPLAFFTDTSEFDFPFGSLLYRKHSALTSQTKAQCHRMAQQCYALAMRMSSQLKAMPVRLPSFVDEDPKTAAQVVRSAMGCDASSPIRGLINRLERCGLWVFKLPDAIERLDAFSTWVTDRPVIVLSNGKPGDRQRHSVCHELGHLLLHRSFHAKFEDLEREADAFASELLLPEEAVRQELVPPITVSGVAAMKARWGSSIQAILYRAKQLSLITERQHKYLCMQISKNGWRTDEPVEIHAEKPRALRKMAEVLYGTPINYKRLAADSNLPPFWVKRIIETHATKEELESRSSRLENQIVQFPQKA